MPAVSRKQQRYLYANMGAAWVKAHHFDVVDPKAAVPKKRKKK